MHAPSLGYFFERKVCPKEGHDCGMRGYGQQRLPAVAPIRADSPPDPPDSIKYCHAMELELLNRFYNTQRKVSIAELIKMKEELGESAASHPVAKCNYSAYGPGQSMANLQSAGV